VGLWGLCSRSYDECFMKHVAFELAYGGMGKLYECVDKTFGVVENCILIFSSELLLLMCLAYSSFSALQGLFKTE
jgi:hypothetical protein